MDIAHAFNNAIRTIDFDYLTEKAREWGKNFADFFNGLRDGLDGELLGKQIAGALNTAMAFVNTFYETYDWDRLGIKLGEGLNSMVENVDWDASKFNERSKRMAKDYYEKVFGKRVG